MQNNLSVLLLLVVSVMLTGVVVNYAVNVVQTSVDQDKNTFPNNNTIVNGNSTITFNDNGTITVTVTNSTSGG